MNTHPMKLDPFGLPADWSPNSVTVDKSFITSDGRTVTIKVTYFGREAEKIMRTVEKSNKSRKEVA